MDLDPFDDHGHTGVPPCLDDESAHSWPFIRGTLFRALPPPLVFCLPGGGQTVMGDFHKGAAFRFPGRHICWAVTAPYPTFGPPERVPRILVGPKPVVWPLAHIGPPDRIMLNLCDNGSAWSIILGDPVTWVLLGERPCP